MNLKRTLTLAYCALAVLLPVLAQTGAAPKSHNMRTSQTHRLHTVAPTQGERVFRQNCSRCHDAPQSFPPQITGTILRHMRLRASMSADDEKALLQFINP